MAVTCGEHNLPSEVVEVFFEQRNPTDVLYVLDVLYVTYDTYDTYVTYDFAARPEKSVPLLAIRGTKPTSVVFVRRQWPGGSRIRRWRVGAHYLKPVANDAAHSINLIGSENTCKGSG